MTTEQPKLEIDFNSSKRWYLNDKLHREDGPAIEYANGAKRWDLHDELHREDGPAIEDMNGDKRWYLNGELHREDGPACEYADGDKFWYLCDKDVTEKVKKLMKKGLSEIEALSFLLL